MWIPRGQGRCIFVCAQVMAQIICLGPCQIPLSKMIHSRLLPIRPAQSVSSLQPSVCAWINGTCCKVSCTALLKGSTNHLL